MSKTVQSAAVEALAQGTPFAEGAVEMGATKAGTCSACDGPDGNSASRDGEMMATIARRLNSTDTADVAASFQGMR